MKDSIFSSLNSNLGFSMFIEKHFKKKPNDFNFPYEYDKRRVPDSFLNNISDSEAKNIKDREIMRDNIFIKYKFDIFEYPFVVFYENSKTEVLKGFKKYEEAKIFSLTLKNENLKSLLILIMNHEIEYELFTN